MTNLSRRDFLFGFRTRRTACAHENRSRVSASSALELPPEFSPALLRAEASRLGLDVDSLSEKELAAAVLREMYRPPQ